MIILLLTIASSLPSSKINFNYRSTNLPKELIENSNKVCTVGLVCDPTRLSDVRRNRVQSMHEDRSNEYTNEKKIMIELENSKKLFKTHNWPIIDVTRKSVEETAASIIKIYEIKNKKNV